MRVGVGGYIVLKGCAAIRVIPQREGAWRAEEQREGQLEGVESEKSDATWAWTLVSIPRTSQRLDKF